MFCTRCGHEVEPGMKFCTNCGAPVSQPMPAASGSASEAVPVPAGSWASAADTDAREDAQAARDAEASLDVTTAAPVAMPVLAEPSYSVSAPVPGPDEPPAAKRRGRLHTGLLVAAVCLLAVIAVGVGYLVISGRPIEATFGQGEPIQASLITRIKPHGEDGKPMSSYTVILVANTEDGDTRDPAASTDTTPYQIQVKGGNGFTVKDFSDDVPGGSYTVMITDKETGTQQSFPMDYQPENPKAKDEVTVAPPAPSKDEGAQKDKEATVERDSSVVAAGLYYDKLKGYIEKYGEPGYESYDNGYTLVATGVTVAKLIDFDGDGNEELLVVYNTNKGLSDEEATSQKGLDGFKVEVWSARDGKLEVVYSEPNSLSTTNGGYAWMQLVQFKGAPALETYAIDVADDGATTEGTGYWQLQDGAFKKVLDAKVSYAQDYSTGMHYLIDGKEVSHDGYLEALEAPIKVLEQFAIFEAPGSAPAEDGRTSHTVEDNAKLTNETLAALKAKTQGEDSGKDDKATTAFVAEDVKEKQIITSYSTEPSGYSQDSLWAYPQFAPEKGKPSKALQSLNSKLKQAYDDALSKQRNMTFEEAMGSDDGGAVEQILWQYDTTAGIQGDIASVRLDRYSYYGGAHGTRYVSGRFYNLTTGEEVPATEALGMSEDEIKQAASSALDSFFAHTPSDMAEYLDADDAISNLFLSDRVFLYRTDDAVVACFTEGSLGSIAFGGHEIVVKALTDKVNVGDDLVDNYRQP